MSTITGSKNLKRKLDDQDSETIRRITKRKCGIPVVKLMRIDSCYSKNLKWFDKNVKSEMKEPSIEELIQFAIDFRERRQKMGMTRKNVTNATCEFDHCIRSVSMLGKFEGLDLQISCAMSYFPYLCLWIDLAEAAKSKGEKEFEEFLSGTKLRRTHQKCFLPTQLMWLSESLNKNPHPSEDDVTDLMLHIGCSRKSILDWFASKRNHIEKVAQRRRQEEKRKEEIRIQNKLKTEKLNSTERRYRISHLQNKINEITKKTSHEEETFKELFPNKRKRTPKKKQQSSKRRKSSPIINIKSAKQQPKYTTPPLRKKTTKKRRIKFDDKISLLKNNSLKHDKSCAVVLGQHFS